MHKLVHLVCRATHKGEDILGVIVNDDELKILEEEAEAMPMNTVIRPVQGLVTDAGVYPLGLHNVVGPYKTWSVRQHHKDQAVKDAAIAGLEESFRHEHFGVDWKPEAVHIAKRTEEQRKAQEIQQAALKGRIVKDEAILAATQAAHAEAAAKAKEGQEYHAAAEKAAAEKPKKHRSGG